MLEFNRVLLPISAAEAGTRVADST